MTLPAWAVIHRDSLSLSPLLIDGSDVGSGVRLKVDDQGILDAVVAYDIDEASSPFVEGSQVTQDIRGMVDQTMRVLVSGPNQATLATGIGVLLAAARQANFLVDLVVGAATYTWSCRRKSYGMSFDRRLVFNTRATIPVNFDRYPTPIAGPF